MNSQTTITIILSYKDSSRHTAVVPRGSSIAECLAAINVGVEGGMQFTMRSNPTATVTNPSTSVADSDTIIVSKTKVDAG